MRSVFVLWLLTPLWGSSALAQETRDAPFEPARYSFGRIPEQPPLASAGGLAVVELEIAPSGIVTDAVTIQDAPPFTELLQKGTRLWRFHPAKEGRREVFSRVLVVGVFRPPVLMGRDIPDPERVNSPSGEAPQPTTTAAPEYPPQALYEGVALVELAVDTAGDVVEAKMLSAQQGFDDVALEAASKFRFRAARRDGRAVPSYALLMFGFRQPLTSPRRPRR